MIAPPTRYIGVTDFTKPEEVPRMVSMFEQHRAGLDCRLHVGVMTNRDMLRGSPTQWRGHYPELGMLAEILSSKEAVNCLHYSDHQYLAGTSDNHQLYHDLVDVMRHGGIRLTALQLDMAWPDPETIENALDFSNRTTIDVILQIGKKAVEQAGTADGFMQRLEQYEDIITHVLIDKSGGEGKLLDVLETTRRVQRAQKALPGIGISIAGGLGPGTARHIEPLIRGISNMSVEAQRRLHYDHDRKKPVDWQSAELYVIEMLALMRETTPIA